MITEAVILAGGKGTRLQSVVSDIPKPMAPIGDIPFLEILIHHLANQGINHVVLAVGYKYEVIQDYFGESWRDVSISYAVESSPLGTGGAVKAAAGHLSGDAFFLLNGDTFFDVSLEELYESFEQGDFPFVLSLKEVKDQHRYGKVTIAEDHITSFEEKQHIDKGFINGGVYTCSTDWWLYESPEAEIFSLEKDVLEQLVADHQLGYLISEGYFIDIGIPEDYHLAQQTLEDYFL